MIIVAGQIHVRPERRDAFLAASIASVAQARRTAGCLDFVVAADPLDPARVNVYERWDSETALAAFRGDGPGPDLTSEILRVDVQRHHVSSSGGSAGLKLCKRQERTIRTGGAKPDEVDDA